MFTYKRLLRIFPLLILLLSIISANEFGHPRFLPLWVKWFVQIFIILLIIFNKDVLCKKNEEHKWVKYYFLWIGLVSIAGLIVADNYTEWKQLINGVICLMMPLYIYLFYDPRMGRNVFRTWYKYAIIIYLLFFVWSRNYNQFYFSPLLILFCIFPLIRSRIKYIIIIAGILYALRDMEGARMQFVKGAFSLLIGVYVLLRNTFLYKYIKIVHVLAYVSVIFLFLYVFDVGRVLSGSVDASAIEYENDLRDDIYKDTRSLLYVDVVRSSIDNHYFLYGRTPSRGFNVYYSWRLFSYGYENQNQKIVFNKGERFQNEMVMTNIYTWCGLIGLILFSLLYMRASYLAVYRSNNRIMPIIGCFVAFRWAAGWIEDVNNFLISDVDLWFFIAICFSDQFRKMSEKQLICWFNSIIPSSRVWLNSYTKGREIAPNGNS